MSTTTYVFVEILISPRKHMLWYSLEAPRRGASNEYPQHMFSWRNKKDISIFRMKKNALSVAMIELLTAGAKNKYSIS